MEKSWLLLCHGALRPHSRFFLFGSLRRPISRYLRVLRAEVRKNGHCLTAILAVYGQHAYDNRSALLDRYPSWHSVRCVVLQKHERADQLPGSCFFASLLVVGQAHVMHKQGRQRHLCNISTSSILFRAKAVVKTKIK